MPHQLDLLQIGELKSAIARTGLPWLTINDNGRDLHQRLALFQGRHGDVVWIYDIKHETVNLLKRELGDNLVWTAFAKRANAMKRQVYQTELAFCNPPQQRGKARYLSVDKLIAWDARVLKWLAGAATHGARTGRGADRRNSGLAP